MKTIKKVFKYKVDKRFVVVLIILLIINILLLEGGLRRNSDYAFLFAFDYYVLWYALVMFND